MRVCELDIDDGEEVEQEPAAFVPEVLTSPGVSSSDDDDDDATNNSDLQIKCSCPKQCLNKFPKDLVENHIFNLREMEKETREAYIMGALDKTEKSGKRGQNGGQKHVRHKYTFNGQSVCREAFKIIFDIGDRVLKNIKKHVKENGNIPRTHGNKGRRPKHALDFADVEKVVKFIITYGNDHGLPQPAAPRGRDDTAPIFLPACTTKKGVHKLYAEGCVATGSRVVLYTAFTIIWRQCCGHIKVIKIYTVCDINVLMI